MEDRPGLEKERKERKKERRGRRETEERRRCVWAARRSPLAAGRSPLAPRPGDLVTPPDNSQRARPLSAQIYKHLPPALLETVAALLFVLVQVAAVHTSRRASFPPGLQRPN